MKQKLMTSIDVLFMLLSEIFFPKRLALVGLPHVQVPWILGYYNSPDERRLSGPSQYREPKKSFKEMIEADQDYKEYSVLQNAIRLLLLAKTENASSAEKSRAELQKLSEIALSFTAQRLHSVTLERRKEVLSNLSIFSTKEKKILTLLLEKNKYFADIRNELSDITEFRIHQIFLRSLKKM